MRGTRDKKGKRDMKKYYDIHFNSMNMGVFDANTHA